MTGEHALCRDIRECIAACKTGVTCLKLGDSLFLELDGVSSLAWRSCEELEYDIELLQRSTKDIVQVSYPWMTMLEG